MTEYQRMLRAFAFLRSTLDRLVIRCRRRLCLRFYFPVMLDDLFAPTARMLARTRGVSGVVVLSAGEESSLFGHLVTILVLCAEPPG